MIQKIIGCLSMRIKGEKKIDSLDNGTHALLLKYRYIDGYSWEEITELLDYSWRSVHYIHNKALDNIAM